jgi:superfamily I DNA/RNA helicase
MVVVGDEMQGIYSFKEADSRYLTMAEDIFSSKMGMLIAVRTIYYSPLLFFKWV